MKRDCPATLSGIHLYREASGLDGNANWTHAEWRCACGEVASAEERERVKEGLRQTLELQRRMGAVEAE